MRFANSRHLLRDCGMSGELSELPSILELSRTTKLIDELVSERTAESDTAKTSGGTEHAITSGGSGVPRSMRCSVCAEHPRVHVLSLLIRMEDVVLGLHGLVAGVSAVGDAGRIYREFI